MRPAERLGVRSPKILARAAELERLAGVRFGKNPTVVSVAIPTASLEVAAKDAGQPVNRKEAIRVSGARRVDYLNTVRAISSLVAATAPASAPAAKESRLRVCAIKFNVVGALSRALELLQQFKIRSSSEYASAIVDEPDYLCAILYVACRRERVKVDRAKLCQEANVTSKRFLLLIEQIETSCKEEEEEQQMKAQQQDDDDDDDDEEEEGETSAKRAKDSTGNARCVKPTHTERDRKRKKQQRQSTLSRLIEKQQEEEDTKSGEDEEPVGECKDDFDEWRSAILKRATAKLNEIPQ